MSRLALLSTTDAVDPLPLARLGPPVRHAEERRAALRADPAYRRREAEKAFEQRHYPTPDGQHQYTTQASALDVASTTVYRAAWAPQSDGLTMDFGALELRRHALRNALSDTDFSALEKRVLALQDDLVMEESPALKPGLDVYAQAAAAHFGVEPALVTKTQRDWIKARMYRSTYSTQQIPALSFDEMLKQIKSFEQDRAAVLKKPTAPVAKPKKPATPTFTMPSGNFYNKLWNKVIDLFKSATVSPWNFTMAQLRFSLELNPHSNILHSTLSSHDNLLLTHAVLALDSYDNRLLSYSTREALRDTCVALSSQLGEVRTQPESVEHLLNAALGACGIPAVSTTFVLQRMTTNARGTVNFAYNTPKQPLPEDDDPEDDAYEAAQLRAYVAQAKD